MKNFFDTEATKGARLITGGEPPKGPELSRGFFVRPTVFDEVNVGMRIAKEEVFGPVISIIPWRDYDRMIEEANSVIYGLTAAIFTDDIKVAHRTASIIEAGYIWINDTATPFGGYEDSGLGREESLEEVLSYTQLKTVHVVLV